MTDGGIKQDVVRVLAFDLGASSGRAILASWQPGTLTYEEIHRFDNIPVWREGYLCWDFARLMDEIHIGIHKAGDFDSVGFDTWGVDFGLLDKNGRLLADPIHYRDKHTDGMCERAFQKIPAQRLYRCTGNQIMPINSLFQLLAVKENQPKLWEQTYKVLFMPDLFAYALCGQMVCERTIASTSQIFDPMERHWNKEVQETFGLRKQLFAPLVESGTVIGEMPLSGGRVAKVISVAGHDTQCAVAAMPSCSEGAVFLSCGTWSLLGVELPEPVLSVESMHLGLSNEVAANGKIDYLKNIIGLWLLQECRRSWQETGQDMTFPTLATLAEQAMSLGCYIDPDAPEFVPPGDMPERIRTFCQRTGQRVPITIGEVSRCVYESLALKYRYALEQLQHLTGRSFPVLHILGGGSNAALLCQMTANSCGIPVVAGPAEATALGNILIQLTALGYLQDLEAGRKLVMQTEQVQTYLPAENRSSWEYAYSNFRKLLEKQTMD